MPTPLSGLLVGIGLSYLLNNLKIRQLRSQKENRAGGCTVWHGLCLDPGVVNQAERMGRIMGRNRQEAIGEWLRVNKVFEAFLLLAAAVGLFAVTALAGGPV